MNIEIFLQRTRRSVSLGEKSNDELEKRFAGEIFRFYVGEHLKSRCQKGSVVLDSDESKAFFNRVMFRNNSVNEKITPSFDVLPHACILDEDSNKVTEVYCATSSNMATWVDNALRKMKKDIEDFPNVFDGKCTVFLITPSDVNIDTLVEGVEKTEVPITQRELGHSVKSFWNKVIVN